MKIKNVLISCSLALAMGLGVGSALLFKEAPKAAKAEDEITYKTYYFDAYKAVSGDNHWWDDANALTYMYAYSSTIQGLENRAWPGQRMYGGFSNYNCYSAANVDSRLDKVIFLRVNPNNITDIWNRTSKDGGVAIDLPNTTETKMMFRLNADFNSGLGYDDGNYAGQWLPYEFIINTHIQQLDNTWTHDQVIVERWNSVPEPTLPFGKSFNGWYLDSEFYEWANSIGYDDLTYTDVYGYVRESDMYSNRYDFTSYTGADVLAGATLKITQDYTPEDDFRTVTIDSSLKGTFSYPERANFYLAALVTDLAYNSANQTYCSYTDGRDMLFIDNRGTEQTPRWELTWKTYQNIPPSDGYYLLSSLNDFRFDNLTENFDGFLKLTDLDPNENDGFIAKYEGYQAQKDEAVMISGYFNGGEERCCAEEHYSFLGDNWRTSYWTPNGDRYIYPFNVAFTYDFYLKANGEFVIKPTDAHVVTVNYVLFNPTYAGIETTTIAAIMVANGEQFVDTLEEYVWLRGLEADALYTGELYEDSALTIPFTGGYLTEDIEVYGKCYQNAPYLVGDICLNNSGAAPWTVDSGKMYTTVASRSKIKDDIFYQDLAVTINFSVPTTASSSDPIHFSTLMMLTVSGGYQQYLIEPQYCPFDLAQEYDFASVSNDHLKIAFTRGGNFTGLAYASVAMTMDENGVTNAIVGIDVELFLLEEDNELANFTDGFLLSIGNTCDANGATDLEALETAWLQQKIVYLMLSDTSKAIIQNVGFDGGNENGNNVEKVIAKYAYIITKYGTDTFDDFIFNGVHSSPKVTLKVSYANINVIITVAIVSTALIATVGLKLFYMKKKER